MDFITEVSSMHRLHDAISIHMIYIDHLNLPAWNGNLTAKNNNSRKN